MPHLISLCIVIYTEWDAFVSIRQKGIKFQKSQATEFKNIP